MAPSSAGSSPHVPACAGFTSGTRSRRSRTWDHPRSRGVYHNNGKFRIAFRGSSPLARGLLALELGQGPGERIIPARAGFTPRRWTPPRPPRDHPRSRGVYNPHWEHGIVAEGSSPLARGLQPPLGARYRGRGIIPARAGFTHIEYCPQTATEDHPRSRGVYTWWRARAIKICWIIPARAGFTPPWNPSRSASRDHPRSRGVYSAACMASAEAGGSSPLARGLRPGGPALRAARGIIPARAGFTPARNWINILRRDHPRSRGVYFRPRRGLRDRRGSSPLARGLLALELGQGPGERIIPARAGFTILFPGRP